MGKKPHGDPAEESLGVSMEFWIMAPGADGFSFCGRASNTHDYKDTP